MSIYEEVEFEDLDFDPKRQIYTYACPCGDKFTINLEDMWEFGEDIATCPSCTLRIRIIYDEVDLPELRQDSDDDDTAVADLDSQLKSLVIMKSASSSAEPNGVDKLKEITPVYQQVQ